MTQPAPTKTAGTMQGIVIVIISFLPMMAIVALMPVVPAIRNNFQHVPYIETLAPLVLSAPGLCVAIFSPFAGYLTDKLGRRKLLIIFSALYGVGGCLPFFIEQFPALLGGRFVLGIGEAFILTVANTLLGDYFDEKSRPKWLMWQGIAGPAMGTVLLSASGYLSTLGWNYPFLVYSIAFLIAGLSYFFIFEPSQSGNVVKQIEPAGEKFPMPLLLRISLTTLVAASLYFVYTLHFALALNAIGVTDGSEIGNYSALASIAVPVGAIIYKFISTKSNNFQFAFLFGLIGLGLLGIGLAVNIKLVIAAAWIQQLGNGMAIPILIGYGLQKVPSQFRGRGMGFWTSGFFLGQFLSPIAVSGMKQLTGDLLTAFIAFGMICLLLAITNLWKNMHNNEGNPTPT
jgi:MFS family permease